MEKFVVLWIVAVILGCAFYFFGAEAIFYLAGVLFVFHIGYRLIAGRWFDSSRLI